jgi:hypothetical protein
VDNVDKTGWVTSLISPAIERSGRATQIVTGLIRNETGGLIFALRIGEGGEEVLVQDYAVCGLIVHMRQMIQEKFREEQISKRPR